MFFDTFPTIPVPEAMKQCQRVTSHELGEKDPFLKKHTPLWTRSYFAAAAGHVSAEAINRLIAMHKGL